MELLKRENEDLKNKLTEQDAKLEVLDSQSRVKNFLLHGLLENVLEKRNILETKWKERSENVLDVPIKYDELKVSE